MEKAEPVPASFLEDLSTKKQSLFKDWSPYRSELILPQLPQGLTYREPKANIDLRLKIEKIKKYLDIKTNIYDWSIVQIALSFLEKGMIIDSFGPDDVKRNELLKNTMIEVSGKRITLFKLKKIMSKLSGNPINNIIFSASQCGEYRIEQDAKAFL